MTPEELVQLADAATEQVRFVGHPDFMEINATLAALAPDLARLCAEMAETLAVGIEDVLLMDSPEGDSPRNIASNLRVALAKLRELEAR